jgi:hypothetical protein
MAICRRSAVTNINATKHATKRIGGGANVTKAMVIIKKEHRPVLANRPVLRSIRQQVL